MQVVILCGGQGTRAYPYTQKLPKALMEIGGVPIVEQVMRIYAEHGHRNFLLSCGYLKEQIIAHFREHPSNWDVKCLDTGDDADTGERIFRLRDQLDPVFMATYCDGLGDVDLNALLEHHSAQKRWATLTVAQFRSQYGLVRFEDDGRVTGFEEKPLLPSLWINGGFFVFDRRVFDSWAGRNLERDVLPHLAERGLLSAYKHSGFWRSMDTHKDQQELNQLWSPFAARYATPPRSGDGSTALLGAGATA